MNEQQALYALLFVAGGGLVGGGLYAFGGSAGRPWALPAAVAIAFVGIDYVTHMPSWMLVAGFLLSLFLVQRSVKDAQERAARSVIRFQVDKKGAELRRFPDPSGKHLALWKAAATDAAPDPLVVGLQFAGVTDDEFRVIVEARAGKFRPGAIVAHHSAARGEAPAILKDVEPLKDLPGQSADLFVRAAPIELGFAAMDSHVLAVLREILELRTDHREVYFNANGPTLRFISTGTFETAELQRLLELATVVFEQLRLVGRQQ
ncbi:MAG: hypothetical protein A2X36_01275 [Elusimicrobia bacterium GWA2_69_24]|nr:MAG: hypothetical protein A2X36_01275 [Elusimicrobia bacterium GWA2_69_24]